MTIQVSLDGVEQQVSSIADLQRVWDAVRSKQFSEVWLSSSAGPALCMLINGEWAWLMYLREKGDSGFSSRNPDYAGDPEEMMDYLLSNGQMDEYPAEWALPLSEARRAAEHFMATGEKAPWVCWHED